jgi:hypothetical protein
MIYISIGIELNKSSINGIYVYESKNIFDKFYGMTYLWKRVINRINKKHIAVFSCVTERRLHTKQ